MTTRQALTEARKRWGKTAAVQERKGGRKIVGHIFMGVAFWVKGEGDTWAEAFEDADRKGD